MDGWQIIRSKKECASDSMMLVTSDTKGCKEVRWKMAHTT